MAEHTPGPWVWREVEDGHDIWLSPVSSHYRPEEKVEYHHGLFREYEDGESVEGLELERFLIAEANAHLIAAAPDLLAACDAAIAFICGGSGGGAIVDEQLHRAVSKARAEGKEDAEQRN